MYTFNSADEKIDFLYNLCAECDEISLNPELRTVINNLAKDKNSEVRLCVAEALACFHDEQSESLLISLLNDDDYLVSCEACISLRNFCDERTLDCLLKKRTDLNYLVRGYAIMSAAKVATKLNKDIDYYLLEMLEDSNEWVIIATLFSFVLIGHYDYKSELFGYVGNRDYRNRSFALSLIDELVDANAITDDDNLMECLLFYKAGEQNQPILEKINDMILHISAKADCDINKYDEM